MLNKNHFVVNIKFKLINQKLLLIVIFSKCKLML
nr:MAG TPA_asm: hypothetical protein [Caudoviricetes sp.]